MPVRVKRKRTAKNGGSAPKRSKKANAESREWQIQYYQGVSSLDFPGLGCGSYLLGSPDLTFHSPLDGLMWFEIMSGTEGQGTGGVRLCAVSDDPNDILRPTFVVPFQHVEQFIVIDESSLKHSTSSKGQAYRAIIVPTAAVGASPLQRTYPKAISFKLPDQKAGKDFKGLIGKASVEPDETYLSLIMRVINEQLAPYQRAVINASSTAAAEDVPDGRTRCHAVFKWEEDEEAKKGIQGELFFLKTGILFHSQTTVVYLTAKSTQTAMLVHNFEGIGSKDPTNVSLICPTSEPYYEGDCETVPEKAEQKGDQTPPFIIFNGIDREMSSSIIQHVRRYGIGLSEVEQEWYSLEDDQPASGWMPRGDRDEMAESPGRDS